MHGDNVEMMMAPQVVGVLLKKPGQQSHPRIPPLDSQETRIRGELYVEDLGEKRIVAIRMGWLWVEGTTKRLPLRALNLRQAPPSHCQPHLLALGFTLSNAKGDSLATFWADTEPIYWSWVRAIAAELVRQTPFGAQRCLNFLEILTICPRGPVPLPDSPTEHRRRSRSELRCWPADSPCGKKSSSSSSESGVGAPTIIFEESRRRARSELRGWSSSNSSDEDLLVGEYRVALTAPSTAALVVKDERRGRTWGCSESSEGSDDSLPWAGVYRSCVDGAEPPPPPTPARALPETREQRIQKYKEARRRENEARSRRVLEEDARRRKARAEENNNNNNDDDDVVVVASKNLSTARSRSRAYLANDNDETPRSPRKEIVLETTKIEGNKCSRLPPVKPSEPGVVRFEESCRNEEDRRNNNNNNKSSPRSNGVAGAGILKADNNERRSRARERRNIRERAQILQSHQTSLDGNNVEIGKERSAPINSRIPIARQLSQSFPVPASHGSTTTTTTTTSSSSLPRSSTSASILEPACEEDVARLLERCQRVDHYVPVREKLTLFESLSRLGGRLARSTEDLGRSSSKPSPRGKQRARSLHDLNRGARALPVREMCRFFEGDKNDDCARNVAGLTRTRFSEPLTPTRTTWREPPTSPRTGEAARNFARKRHCAK